MARKRNANATANTQATVKPAAKAKKPGPIKRFQQKHPKLTKAGSITAKVVITGLAAVGGTGLCLAINDRIPARKASAPEIPDLPDIPAVAPVSEPAVDVDTEE